MSYPITMVLRTRELSAAGWSRERIQDLLEREGYGRPSHTTVGLWADPAKYEAHMNRSRAQQRAKAAAETDFRLRGSTPEYKRAFMERLRSQGLSCHAVGVVHGVVFGERLTEHQVRYALRELPTTVGA
jgi:hypothetical protein